MDEDPGALPLCKPGSREPLGDEVTLGAMLGSDPDPSRWVEIERVVWPDYAFVTLARPGKDAAFVLLARGDDGHCVQAVMNSFRNNDEALSISDIARTAEGTMLFVLEAVPLFNDPAGSTGDSFDHRRLVMVVAGTRAGVIADTQAQGPFQGYHAHHWYFEGPTLAHPGDHHVIATSPQGSMRWRFDANRWKLVPLPSQQPTSRK